MKQRIIWCVAGIILFLCAIGSAARADSSSVMTVGNHMVECHSTSSSSVSASSGTWTLKIDGRDFVIDADKFTWGDAHSKDLPKDWEQIEITSADGKATVKVDGEDFVEIKD